VSEARVLHYITFIFSEVYLVYSTLKFACLYANNSGHRCYRCRVAHHIILYINRNNLAYPLYDSLKNARSQCQHSEALSLSDMIINHFCSMSCIPHVKNSHKFYLTHSLPNVGWPFKMAGHRDSGEFVTGHVTRPVSAVRLGSRTSLAGLRAPRFRFFVVSYVFVVESEPPSSSSTSLVSHYYSALEHC